MTTVRELMSPVAATIFVTQSLEDAAALVHGREVRSGEVSRGETAVLVLSLSHQPAGLITEADLAEMAARRPGDWRKKRCACLAAENLDFLRPDHPVDGVLRRYRANGAKPLLVIKGTDPVGIVYPEAVFAWCAEQQSPVRSGTSTVLEHSSGSGQHPPSPTTKHPGISLTGIGEV